MSNTAATKFESLKEQGITVDGLASLLVMARAHVTKDVALADLQKQVETLAMHRNMQERSAFLRAVHAHLERSKFLETQRSHIDENLQALRDRVIGNAQAGLIIDTLQGEIAPREGSTNAPVSAVEVNGREKNAVPPVTEARTRSVAPTAVSVPAAAPPASPAAPEGGWKNYVPQTWDPREWNSTQVATVVTATVGVVGLYALWHWWKHRGEKKEGGQEKKGLLSWLKWIPIVGLLGVGLYEGHKLLMNVEKYAQAVDTAKAEIASLVQRAKDRLPFVGKGEGEKYGLSKENYEKAEEAFDTNRESDAIPEIRNLFGLQEGATSKQYEEFLAAMRKKYETRKQPGGTVNYQRLEVALAHYEKHLELGIKCIIKWLQDHPAEEIGITLVAAKLHLLLPILRGGETAAVKAVEITKTIAGWGFKTLTGHPFLSLFAMGGGILAARSAVAPGQELFLPENLRSLGQACARKEPLILGATDALAKIMDALGQKAVKFAEAGENIGPWLEKQFLDFIKKLDEAMPRLIGDTDAERIENQNRCGLYSLRFWLDQQLGESGVSKQRKDAGEVLHFNHALKALNAFETALTAERGKNVPQTDAPERAYEDLKRALQDIPVSLEESGGIVRWRYQDKDPQQLCMAPHIRDIATLRSLADTMRPGEQNARNYFLARVKRYGQQRAREAHEKLEGVPLLGASDTVAMVLGNALFFTDWRNDKDTVFWVPLHMVYGLFTDKSWAEYGSNVLTGVADTALLSIPVVLFSRLKNIAIGGGYVFSLGDKASVFKNVTPWVAHFFWGRGAYRGYQDMNLLKDFLANGRQQGLRGIWNEYWHGRRITSILARAADGPIRPEWIGMLESATDYETLDKVAGKLHLPRPDPTKSIPEIRAAYKKTILGRLSHSHIRQLSSRNWGVRLFNSDEVGFEAAESVYKDALRWYQSRTAVPSSTPATPAPPPAAASAPPSPAVPAPTPAKPASQPPATPTPSTNAPSNAPQSGKASGGGTNGAEGAAGTGAVRPTPPETPGAGSAATPTPEKPLPAPKPTGVNRIAATAGPPAIGEDGARAPLGPREPASGRISVAPGAEAAEGSLARVSAGTKFMEMARESLRTQEVMGKVMIHPNLLKALDDSPEFAQLFIRHLETAPDAERLVHALNGAVRMAPNASYVAEVMSTNKGFGRIAADVGRGVNVAKALGTASKASPLWRSLKLAGKAAPFAADALVLYITAMEMVETSAELERLRNASHRNEELIHQVEGRRLYHYSQLGLGIAGAGAGGCLLVGAGTAVAAPVAFVTLPVSLVLAGAYQAHKWDEKAAHTVRDWRDVPLAQRLADLRSYSMGERAGHLTRVMAASMAEAELASGGVHDNLVERTRNENMSQMYEIDEKQLRSIVEDTTTVVIPQLVRDEKDGTIRPPNAAEISRYQEELRRYVEARVQFFLFQRKDKTHAVRSGDIVELLEQSEYAGRLAMERPNLAEQLRTLEGTGDEASLQQAAALKRILQQTNIVEQVKLYRDYVRQEEEESLPMQLLVGQMQADSTEHPEPEEEVARLLYERVQPALLNFQVRCEEDNIKTLWPDGDAGTLLTTFAQEKVQDIVWRKSMELASDILAGKVSPINVSRAVTLLQLEVERFLATPRAMWDRIPADEKARRGSYAFRGKTEVKEDSTDILHEGEKLMYRIGATAYGSYYTVRFGWIVTPLFCSFDAVQGKWLVGLGGDKKPMRDPAAFHVTSWFNTEKYNQIVRDLDAINRRQKPSL